MKSNKFGDELPGTDGEKQRKTYSRKTCRKKGCLKAAITAQDLLAMVIMQNVTIFCVFVCLKVSLSSCTCASLYLSFSLAPHLFLPLISPKMLSSLSSFFPPSFLFLPPLLFFPPSVSPSFGHFS